MNATELMDLAVRAVASLSWRVIAAVVITATVPQAFAQQAPQGIAQPSLPVKPSVASQPVDPSGPITLDRVMAIVNGDLILQSDIESEARFAAFQPFSDPKPMTQDDLINRLIDRTLIVQQMFMQPGAPITDDEVNAELSSLRKAIPKCAAYHCETDAGWQKFVADQGFTISELRERWRQRMQLLRFIEERFRMGIRISQAEVDEYYKTTMLPVYTKEGAAPPAEATIADRIQEILLQQRVDKLLDDWLNSLRAEGGVQILKPGEELQ